MEERHVEDVGEPGRSTRRGGVNGPEERKRGKERGISTNRQAGP
jgi:hypothetical protein